MKNVFVRYVTAAAISIAAVGAIADVRAERAVEGHTTQPAQPTSP